MILSWRTYGALALLALTRHLVLGSVDDEWKKVNLSTKILNHLQVSWMEGLDWLAHSPDSSDLKEVKAWIQGVESSETWALEVLDDVLERRCAISRKKFPGDEIFSQGDQVDAQYNDISNRDDRCSDSLVDNVCDTSGKLSHLSCHRSEKHKTESVKSEYQTREASKDFSGGERFTLYFFLTIGAFIFVCTICDVIRRHTSRNTSTTMKTLAKFSLYTNALNLVSRGVTSDEMQAIHGLRFLSCCMVMSGHHYALFVILLREEFTVMDILGWKNSWLAVFLSMVLFSVDTFFLISGFLTAYLFLKAKRSGTKFNVLTMYLQRYLRLTPCLGVLLLVVVNLYHCVGSTLLWDSSFPPVDDNCRQNWWVNLLYIQNIANIDTLCLPYTWYLAADMQLFWMSPIILYPLHRWPKIGLRILCFFLIGSVCTSTVHLVVNGYTNALLRLDVEFSRVLENFGHYYIFTFNRSFPYFSGILLGYDVAAKKRRLTQGNVAINWIVAFGLFVFCVWANYKVHNSNFAYNLGIEILFVALVRPSWSIAIAWTIFACSQGYGGVATRFLSAPLFVPLSRISYCIYLIHTLVQGFVITALGVPTTFSGFEITYGIFLELILLITLAVVFSLFIECPVNVLVKIMTNRGHQSKPATVAQQPHEYGKVATRK